MADGQQATDGLIEQLTSAWAEYSAGFKGGGDETLWGLNLSSFMGSRMGPVLARLHAAEDTVAELAADKEALALALIEANNPGIDMDEVRARRSQLGRHAKP